MKGVGSGGGGGEVYQRNCQAAPAVGRKARADYEYGF